MSFFGDVFDWIGGNSISATIVKTVGLGYASKLLNESVNDKQSNTTNALEIDRGVNLQFKPSTETKIPVLYGDAYMGGYLTDAILSSDYKTMKYSLVLSEQTGNLLSDASQSNYTFYDVYFDNQRVVFKSDGVTVDYTVDSSGNQDVSKRDLIKVYFYTSNPLQPDGYSGTTPASDVVMDTWTAATHPMTNLVYAIVEVHYNKAQGVTGLPTTTFHVKNTMSLPGDVLYDYMSNSSYGADIPLSELDVNTLTDANTLALAGFTYKDSSLNVKSGKILINGLVNTSLDVLTNINFLSSAISGWMSYNIHDGLWSLILNKPGTSVASLSDDHILGSIDISGSSLTALYNKADIRYQNTDLLDKTDFVKLSINPNDLYANEPNTTLQINLPFTNQQAVAIKVGLIGIKQSRIDKIISFKTDYSFINLKAGQLIDITSDVYGFSNKIFRIISIKEVEDRNGTLNISFKCLEYDPSVYVYDITEFSVETDDGILSIGSIGKPDVPLLSLFAYDATPRIEIDAGVPSGVVDVMEYWTTFDTTISNDADRTYTLSGTQRNTNGATFTENQRVVYDYKQAIESDVIVKVRGTNSITVGPFSDPSPLIHYKPIVVADTVSDTPDTSIGMNLGWATLIKLLNGVLDGESGIGSVFDKIFGIFKDETGVDIVQDAIDGNLGTQGPPGPPGPPGANGQGIATTQNITKMVISGESVSGSLGPLFVGFKWYINESCEVVTDEHYSYAAVNDSLSVNLFEVDTSGNSVLIETISGSSKIVSYYNILYLYFSDRNIGPNYDHHEVELPEGLMYHCDAKSSYCKRKFTQLGNYLNNTSDIPASSLKTLPYEYSSINSQQISYVKYHSYNSQNEINVTIGLEYFCPIRLSQISEGSLTIDYYQYSVSGTSKYRGSYIGTLVGNPLSHPPENCLTDNNIVEFSCSIPLGKAIKIISSSNFIQQISFPRVSGNCDLDNRLLQEMNNRNPLPGGWTKVPTENHNDIKLDYYYYLPGVFNPEITDIISQRNTQINENLQIGFKFYLRFSLDTTFEYNWEFLLSKVHLSRSENNTDYTNNIKINGPTSVPVSIDISSSSTSYKNVWYPAVEFEVITEILYSQFYNVTIDYGFAKGLESSSFSEAKTITF